MRLVKDILEDQILLARDANVCSEGVVALAEVSREALEIISEALMSHFSVEAELPIVFDIGGKR